MLGREQRARSIHMREKRFISPVPMPAAALQSNLLLGRKIFGTLAVEAETRRWVRKPEISAIPPSLLVGPPVGALAFLMVKTSSDVRLRDDRSICLR